ncbi:hypothetical protein BH23DEI1_BH23DEI1_07790 [soil metagenome]
MLSSCTGASSPVSCSKKPAPALVHADGKRRLGVEVPLAGAGFAVAGLDEAPAVAVERLRLALARDGVRDVGGHDFGLTMCEEPAMGSGLPIVSGTFVTSPIAYTRGNLVSSVPRSTGIQPLLSIRPASRTGRGAWKIFLDTHVHVSGRLSLESSRPARSIAWSRRERQLSASAHASSVSTTRFRRPCYGLRLRSPSGAVPRSYGPVAGGTRSKLHETVALPSAAPPAPDAPHGENQGGVLSR